MKVDIRIRPVENGYIVTPDDGPRSCVGNQWIFETPEDLGLWITEYYQEDEDNNED